LRIPQFLIGVASSGYHSVDLRFAPSVVRSVSPSDQSSDSRRRSISGSAFQLNLRLSSSARLFGQPSNRCPACALNQSSGPAFQPIFDSRLRSTFGSAFQSTCDRRHTPIFRPSFRLTSGSRLQSIFQLSFSVRVQLAPSANVPALPPNPTSDSHRLLCSPGAALWSIRDRRRRSTFRPCLRTQPPTLIVRRIPSALLSGSSATCVANSPSSLACGSSLRLLVRCAPSALPSGFTCDLRRRLTLSAQPVDPTSDSSTAVFSGGAFRLTFNLRLGSTFQLAFYLIFDFRLRLLIRRRL